MAAALVCGALLFGFIIVLTRVLYKAFLMDKIHTEASQCEREDQSATTTSTMMNLEEVGGEFERSVIDEGQGIPIDKIHMEASQREREDESATTTSKMMNLKEVGREFERSVIDEGNQIRERIKRLLKQARHLRLNKGVPNRPLQRLHAPLVVKESDVVGRDGDKKKIIELLLSADTSRNNLSVIPIVGMGGIGKTTLAQLVYEDSRVQQHFALKVWVTVSEHFNVFQITKAIFQKVDPSQKLSTTELRELQRELNKALAGKMFLFVLDDVWNENYGQWDSLKSAFQSGADGSTIIVTTRSKDVALTMSKRVMHELKLVSDDDCWQIFENHAFDDGEATAEVREIGREIVKRCKGLPLAVKSIAGLLRCTSKPEGWRKILNSDIWQLQFQTDLKKQVVPAVWLSYQFLPPYLKRCFAYLSIFPKDYLFDMKTIIRLWMAEDLLEAEKGKRAEEVGEEYLQALIGRSFFQYSSQDESELTMHKEEPNKLIMHDIVHDLAMFLSGEFSFVVNDSRDLSNLPTKACHLSISTKGPEVAEIMKGLTSQTRSLRTFLLLSPSYPPPILEKSLLHELFLKVGGCLRVLSLSPSYIEGLPDSIGNMKCLRYLDLSGSRIKELPDSISTLYNLQTLLLSSCQDLVGLPTRIAALVNLRHLELGDLRLQGENANWKIKELGELPLLGGRLRISGLLHIVEVKDVLEANLKDKKFLSKLILQWASLGEFYTDLDLLGASSGGPSSRQERVLEALQPHKNLKQLGIGTYGGTIFPDWVGHESFCNMVEVWLINCRNVCRLPPLGQLSSLRRLVIEGLAGVVSIGNEFCGSSSATTNHPFTSLEVLVINYMGSWKEWSFSSDRLGQEGGVFPSLQELRINWCHELLVALPDCHFPSLKSIGIKDCLGMVGVFVGQSREEMDPNPNAFPSLKSMNVENCPRVDSLMGRPREGYSLVSWRGSYL